MVDSTCVIHQGDSIRVLGESVSFGKFKNQTLEWDKFSAFNQNRYLEEAHSLAKPGLVAQRKALFEAHFKKPVDINAANKVPGLLKASNLYSKSGNRVLSNDANKENIFGEPCKEVGLVKSRCGYFINVAKRSTDTSLQLDLPRSAPVIEPKSVEKTDSIDVLKLEMEAKQSEVTDISTSPMPISKEKIAVEEPVDKFVLALTVGSQPAATSSNTLTSAKKPAVWSPCKRISQTHMVKENNAPENLLASGIDMFNRKTVVKKSLHAPRQNARLTVNKKHAALKKLDNSKCHTSSVSVIHSKENYEQVTASDASSSNRKSSAKLYLRSAPPQVKKKMAIARTDKTSMRNSVLQKATSKLETPTFSRRTGPMSVSTSVMMSKTFSTHAPGSQVLSDATNMGKQMISSSTTFGRRSTVQLRANSLNISGCNVKKSNLKKPFSKAPHISLDPSSNAERAKRTTMVQKRGSSRITALEVRVSKTQETLQKLVRTSTTPQLDDQGSKRRDRRLDDSLTVTNKATSCPKSSVNLTRPPATVSIPFRFRSDERAAKRKQKLEDRSNVEAENPLQSKKAKSTTSYRFPHIPATMKSESR